MALGSAWVCQLSTTLAGITWKGRLVSLDHQQQLWLDDRHRDYHRRQFAEPYRSTLALRQFVRETLTDCDRPYQALEVGCGAGANLYHLGQLLTRTRWVGVDIATHFFELGRELIAEMGGTPISIEFLSGDFYKLTEQFSPRSFDLVFSIQVLSWVPEYESLLPQLLAMARPGGHVFVTSLFTDFLMDVDIQITQYPAAEFGSGKGPYPYNIYCFDRFRERCKELGAADVTAKDFEIDIDLPPPADRQLGTYTRRLEGGRRLQCSGPLLMPWKFVAVRMGQG